jgi:hypothetical protein
MHERIYETWLFIRTRFTRFVVWQTCFLSELKSQAFSASSLLSSTFGDCSIRHDRISGWSKEGEDPELMRDLYEIISLEWRRYLSKTKSYADFLRTRRESSFNSLRIAHESQFYIL